MSTVPGFLVGLVDDAAIFPPGNASLTAAVTAHAEHRRAPYSALVGPFVISDIRLPELLEILDDEQQPLGVTVVVTGGAGAVAPAVRWATKSGLLDVCSLETPLRGEDDLARNATRVVTAIDEVRGDLGDIPVYVEPPRVLEQPRHGWLVALDEIAAADLRVKFRTGGVDVDAFPTAAELGLSIDAALDRELAFKCTAGLHHAVAQRDPATGADHHGFLNILLATRAALSGQQDPDWTALTQRDPAALVTLLDAYTFEELEAARRWFTSFGCCSVLEPLEDLLDLGLVDL